jgi:hypothetical protein
MAVAIDRCCVYTVTEEGSLWEQHCDPAHVGRAAEFLGTTPQSRVVVVAASATHAACVTEDGALFTRHDSSSDDDDEPTRPPWGRVRAVPFAVMVACGLDHILVLTDNFAVWSCGIQDTELQTWKEQVFPDFSSDRDDATTARHVQMHMVAAGNFHCMALGRDGSVWTWGQCCHGQLGFGDLFDDNAPKRVMGLADSGQPPCAFIACGGHASATINVRGELFMWGDNSHGQLGQGLDSADHSTTPQWVALAPASVVAVSISGTRTLAIDADGALWAWGSGGGLASSAGETHSTRERAKEYENIDSSELPQPTGVDLPFRLVEGFKGRVVCAVGLGHVSVIVTEYGLVNMWYQRYRENVNENPFGTGWGLAHPMSASYFRAGRFHDTVAPDLATTFSLCLLRPSKDPRQPVESVSALSLGVVSRLARFLRSRAVDQSPPAGLSDRPETVPASPRPQVPPHPCLQSDILQVILRMTGTRPPGLAGSLAPIARLLGGGLSRDRGTE